MTTKSEEIDVAKIDHGTTLLHRDWFVDVESYDDYISNVRRSISGNVTREVSSTWNREFDM